MCSLHNMYFNDDDMPRITVIRFRCIANALNHTFI